MVLAVLAPLRERQSCLLGCRRSVALASGVPPPLIRLPDNLPTVQDLRGALAPLAREDKMAVR